MSGQKLMFAVLLRHVVQASSIFIKPLLMNVLSLWGSDQFTSLTDRSDPVLTSKPAHIISPFYTDLLNSNVFPPETWCSDEKIHFKKNPIILAFHQRIIIALQRSVTK